MWNMASLLSDMNFVEVVKRPLLWICVSIKVSTEKFLHCTASCMVECYLCDSSTITELIDLLSFTCKIWSILKLSCVDFYAWDSSFAIKSLTKRGGGGVTNHALMLSIIKYAMFVCLFLFCFVFFFFFFFFFVLFCFFFFVYETSLLPGLLSGPI